jgi:hypothetical protein
MSTTENTSWRRFSLEIIGELPESPAVFEIANLVRSVQYIGSADNLKERLTTYWQELRPSPGGYYFRFHQSQKAGEEALATHLASYRAAHGGLLPNGNALASSGTAAAAPAVRVAARRAA